MSQLTNTIASAPQDRLGEIQRLIPSLETRVSAQNAERSISALAALQTQISTLQQELNKLEAPKLKKQLIGDRLAQLQKDVQMLLGRASELVERPQVEGDYQRALRDSDASKQAHRLLDETIELGGGTLAALKKQGEKLHEIHSQILRITDKLMIGDKSVSQIMRLESFGSFICIGGVAIVLLIWFIFKFLL